VPIERIRVIRPKPPERKTLADKFVNVIGSWNFIVGQFVTMVLWCAINVTTPAKPDPYPFILLNLILSTQAALLGPIILMSNNRQGELDRNRDIEHYQLDIRESKMVEEIATELDKIARHLHIDDEEHW
jgi:uncharacterized membrane protein